MEDVIKAAVWTLSVAIGTVLGNLGLMGIVRWRSNKVRKDGLKMLQEFETQMRQAQMEQGQGDGEPT